MFTLFYFTWGIFGGYGFSILQFTTAKKYRNYSLLGLSVDNSEIIIYVLYMKKRIKRSNK